MKKMHRRIHPAWLLFLALWAVTASLCAQIPSGFLTNEKIAATKVNDGVVWYKVSGELKNKPGKQKQELHVLEIDRKRQGLSMETVVGGRRANVGEKQFFQRSHPRHFAMDHNLLAALNASFFDISGSQSPSGLLIRDGLLLRNPEDSRISMLVLRNDELHLAQPGWEAEVTDGKNTVALRAVNEPATAHEGVVMYLPPWARTLGTDAKFLTEPPQYELILQRTGLQPPASNDGWTLLRGRVIEKRPRRSSRNLKADEFVLVPYGEQALRLLDLSAGDSLQVRWRLTRLPDSIPANSIREAIAAGPALVQDGNRIAGSSKLWTTKHPRSAVGWSDKADKIWWVLVDGRSESSTGMDLNTLAAYFEHLQAQQALNLDGGGSSALAISINGRVRVVNTPSDGHERYVPTAIGLRKK